MRQKFRGPVVSVRHDVAGEKWADDLFNAAAKSDKMCEQAPFIFPLQKHSSSAGMFLAAGYDIACNAKLHIFGYFWRPLPPFGELITRRVNAVTWLILL